MTSPLKKLEKNEEDTRVDDSQYAEPLATAAENETIPARDGDVYRFAYNQSEYEKARGDLNWCFDGQLVCRNGQLHDTYWGLERHGDTGRSFSVAEAQAQGLLRFVCNLNDVEKIQEYEYPLYADGDAFNLSHQHSCYKYYVKRRGAKKDQQLMLDALNRKVQNARDDIDRAVRNLEYAVERRQQLTPRIEAGEEPSI